MAQSADNDQKKPVSNPSFLHCHTMEPSAEWAKTIVGLKMAIFAKGNIDV